jgi:hypothetical protein
MAIDGRGSSGSCEFAGNQNKKLNQVEVVRSGVYRNCVQAMRRSVAEMSRPDYRFN